MWHQTVLINWGGAGSAYFKSIRYLVVQANFLTSHQVGNAMKCALEKTKKKKPLKRHWIDLRDEISSRLDILLL